MITILFKISLQHLPSNAFFASILQDPWKAWIFCQPGFQQRFFGLLLSGVK